MSLGAAGREKGGGQHAAGIRVQTMLMDLITGTPDVESLTDLLGTAYRQL